ncbi:hypothetical protein D3C86_2009550 [compost metagenome]
MAAPATRLGAMSTANRPPSEVTRPVSPMPNRSMEKTMTGMVLGPQKKRARPAISISAKIRFTGGRRAAKYLSEMKPKPMAPAMPASVLIISSVPAAGREKPRASCR